MDDEAERRRADFERAMSPDPTKEGIFRDHNCGGCQSGALPCLEGNPRNCSWPRARND